MNKIYSGILFLLFLVTQAVYADSSTNKTGKLQLKRPAIANNLTSSQAGQCKYSQVRGKIYMPNMQKWDYKVVKGRDYFIRKNGRIKTTGICGRGSQYVIDHYPDGRDACKKCPGSQGANAAPTPAQQTVQTGRKVTIKEASFFKEWKKVKKNARNNTHLVLLSEPGPDKVENVVFISAGQQQPNPADYNNTYAGYPNVLTGQLRYYKNACKGKQQCAGRIHPDSLAERLYRSPQFPPAKTLFVLVFDAQFNHLRNDRVKKDIENAFWNFLTGRFYSGKVKKIVLAGQSKGGCLAFLLGKRFRHTAEYANIPLIVQGYDPVCKKGQLYAQGNKQMFSNPLKNKPRYKSMYVNMDAVFPPSKRRNLALLDIHSGAPVVSVLFGHGVHSFTFKPNNVDLGWWKQTWVPFEHTDMGGNMAHARHTVIPGYQHIMKYAQRFASYHPPGGGVINSGAKICPTLFPTQVGSRNGKPVCTAKYPKKIKTKKCAKKKGMLWQGRYCLWGKKKFWHARPLKRNQNANNAGNGARCPVQYPRKVGSRNSKPLCMAAASRKIKKKNCNTVHGSYCVWYKGSYYKARRLK